jgi:hypothetical protein
VQAIHHDMHTCPRALVARIGRRAYRTIARDQRNALRSACAEKDDFHALERKMQAQRSQALLCKTCATFAAERESLAQKRCHVARAHWIDVENKSALIPYHPADG